MKMVEWALRVAVFGTFLGHGLIALIEMPEKWMRYLEIVGFSLTDTYLLKIIGVIDIVLAVAVLLKPLKPVLLYCAFWALITALMRPLAGEGILEFVERSANFLAPAALYLLLRHREEQEMMNR